MDYIRAYVNIQTRLNDLSGHVHLLAQRSRVVHGKCEHGFDEDTGLDGIALQYPNIDQAYLRNIRVLLATHYTNSYIRCRYKNT